MKINTGNDVQAKQMGGDIVGDTGTTTSAPTATTVSDTGKAWTVNAWLGHIVTMGAVYGVVVSNTATVLTIDRWYVPATPGGAVGTTPGSGVYQIMAGCAPGIFMGITATATAPSSTDTLLTGEIATAGGGLIRKISSYGHTSGVASYTLTTVFTVNGSDTIPVTIAQMAVFISLISTATGMMLYRTLLSATATLSAIADALTVTETVTN